MHAGVVQLLQGKRVGFYQKRQLMRGERGEGIRGETKVISFRRKVVQLEVGKRDSSFRIRGKGQGDFFLG